MQRYRVNYGLLIGLLVGTLVAGGSVYGIWRWQMTNNAADMLDQATAAEQKGDHLEAVKQLNNYLGFRPDDDEARVRQAKLYVLLAQKSLDAGEIREFNGFRGAVSNVLFKYPGETELREDYVDLLGTRPDVMAAFAKEQLGHVEALLKSKPDDVGLLTKQAQCHAVLQEPAKSAEVLEKLVGYDRETKKFSDEAALAPNDIDAYRMLIRTQFQLNRRDQAKAVAEQMLRRNPDSAQAHLAMGQYYNTIDQGEGSREDHGAEAIAAMQKAYELDPKDSSVLLALAAEALGNRDFETAQKYLEEGLASGTDNRVFYSGLAGLEREKGDTKAALEQIERGLEKVDEKQRPYLLIDKIDIQIDEKNLTGAENSIKELEKQIDFKLPQVEFQEARILAAREDWLPATRALEEVRPKLAEDRRLRLQLDLLLSLAYQKVGSPEKALPILEQLAREFPKNPLIDQQLAALNARVKGETTPGQSVAGDFPQRLTEEIRKPEAEQDWVAFDKYVTKWAEENKRSEVQLMLLRAQVMVARKKYAEAREILRTAFDMAKDDLNVRRAAARLVAVDPERGPEDAMKLLDLTVQQFGDQWQLRLDRADLIVAMNKETMAQDLLALTEGIDDWEQSHKIELWKGIATRLGRVGKRDESEDAWKKIAELNPNDLPTLMQVFDMALMRNDDEDMQAAQKKVLELVGTKKDANWAFTEAARKFVQYRNEPNNEQLKKEILALVNTSLAERPDWSDPYILRAAMAVNDRDYIAALADYKEGFARGRGNAQALAQYVRLLAAQGSFAEAAKELEQFDPAINVALVGELYPQILLQTGKFRDAAEAADRLAAAGAENGPLQLWYGQFMQGMSTIATAPEDLRKQCQEKAGVALAKAVELQGDSPAPWLAHITNLLTSGKAAEAEEALRQAQLVLEEDQQPLLLARCYENMGRWFDAEGLYRLAYEQNPDADNVARQLATFYLSQRYPLGDGPQKAVPLINEILKDFAADPESVSRDNATWARRTAAQMLAATRDYQNLLQAEKLLASNSVNGALAVDDKIQMATILSARPEPVSRNKAIKLLEEVRAQQPLPPELDLKLGQLYFAVGNWPKSRDHMESVITKYPEAPVIRDAYIRMLVTRGGPEDLRIARERQLPQLARLAPNSPATLELASIVYDKSGDKTRAKQALQRMMPSDLSKLDANGYQLVARVASLLASQGDTENAEKLLQTLVSRPEATLGDQLQFAQFIGVYRDPARAFEMLDQMSNDSNALPVIDTAINIIRTKRDEIGDKYDAKVQTWIDNVRRDDPQSIAAALSEANLCDIQGRYEDAAALYRKVLQNTDLAGTAKAAVLNNLAYLLALGAAEEQTADEAVKLMKEATDILGPMSDVLDTRATIWLNRGEYQAAVDDMTLAVTDGPTASKYFHKAQAHMGLNQKSEALAAWKRAEELGLTRETVGRLEEKDYDELAAQIEKLKKQGNNL
ncbi:tetratricopeptide repeat protein [Aeoliella sp. SH292]|uniref:tetratricopeptide repeat protein n=1 Tax=Aeoliella sp. SH292 TaxID=3454464 RepID=UPI003F964DC3